ncbi:AMP-binding protein [Streptomyces luomodiensis]|uniref:AMP-binding protein n=1 Tax=Streptomyces luomodiensis TaxID=3026192 RepID=A0ABY9UUF5_9ACTN|nr:AMP-binding protein [Streptomyces sp. SCA4-21]WNE95504.1 AMP-binding protein [Streptomyces sp. SCA4-21]
MPHTSQALTIADCIDEWGRAPEDRRGFDVFSYPDGTPDIQSLTARELAGRVRAHAVRMAPHINSGSRVAILLPQSMDYVVSMLATIYAGGIAVPLFEPDRQERSGRLRSVLADAEADVWIAHTDARDYIWDMAADPAVKRPRNVVWADEPVALDVPWDPVPTAADDPAYLQYTSGSTSSPSGVVVSHANVLSNVGQFASAFEVSGEANFVSWLPLFHDMGLIAAVMAPLVLGRPSAIMSPESFLRDPVRWLRLMSAWPDTYTASPNFGYERVVDRMKGKVLPDLSLASARVWVTGSEPVKPSTLERFGEVLRNHGGSPEQQRPAYGLAEATLLVTTAAPRQMPRTVSVDRHRLREGVAKPVGRTADDGVLLVSCGTPCGQDIVAVDPDTRTVVPDGALGEIWVSGPNVARTYWRKPERTRRVLNAQLADTEGAHGPDKRWLRTGDTGLVLDGELYFGTRIDDMIVSGGRNIFPHDVEATVESLSDRFVRNRSVAFHYEDSSTQGLIVVAEFRGSSESLSEDRRKLREVVRSAVVAAHDIAVLAVVLVRPGTIPLTTSGKVARSACRAAYAESRLAEIDPSAEPAEPHAADDHDGPLEALVRACGILLRRSDVDPARSFSDLGGDSVLALRASAMCAQAGADVDLGALTSGKPLSEAVSAAPVRRQPEPLPADTATDLPVPISPQQKQFLSLPAANLGNWDISIHLETLRDIDFPKLAAAVELVAKRHDVLRMRFTCDESGRWEQLRDQGDGNLIEVEYAEIEADSAAELDQLVDHHARVVEQRRDIANGPLISLLALEEPRNDVWHLVLSTHHLCADAYTLSMLLHEIQDMYGQIGAPTPPKFVPITTPYTTWAHELPARAVSDAVQRQRPFWAAQVQGHKSPLRPEHGESSTILSSRQSQQVRLSPADTALITNAAFHGLGGVDELTMAALANALGGLSDSGELLFMVRNHGRQLRESGMDLSWTAGWFTNAFPLRFPVSPGSDMREVLSAVRNKLSSVPGSGEGYGLLRYLDGERGAELEATPDVSFNYLGQLDAGLSDIGFGTRFAQRQPALPRDPNLPVSWKFNVKAGILGGSLTLQVAYLQSRYSRDTVRRLLSRTVDDLMGIVRP